MQLTLTSQPQTTGTYCPGPVTFTCVGIEITGLFLLVNGSTVASYSFRVGDTFPLPLEVDPPLDGVMAEITSASFNQPGAVTIDIISELSVSDVSILNGASLQCETAQTRSNMLRIDVDALSKLNNYIGD